MLPHLGRSSAQYKNNLLINNTVYKIVNISDFISNQNKCVEPQYAINSKAFFLKNETVVHFLEHYVCVKLILKYAS